MTLSPEACPNGGLGILEGFLPGQTRSIPPMFISIKDLEVRKLDFNEQFRPGHIELGTELEQRGELRATGTATLLEEHRGGKNVVQDIRLVGNLETTVEMRCARCLEPVSRPIRQDFDLLYRPLGADAGPAERHLADADVEIGYFQGEGLHLEDVLKEQVLLAAPVKAVCRENCQGLCPQCGVNRNQKRCDCTVEVPDPRWSALNEIRDKLGE
jgi:uncharacterized protein